MDSQQTSIPIKAPKLTTIGPVFTWIIIMTILGLIALNVWQFTRNADLRVGTENCRLQVENEADRCDMFLQTKNLIIRDYLLIQDNECLLKRGESLIESEKVLLQTLETIGKKNDSGHGK